MTTPNDIQTAIIQHLLTMPGRWFVRTPNLGGQLPANRIVIDISANRQTAEGNSRATEIVREVIARVEGPEGKGDTDVNSQADLILNWFKPRGLLIGGGMVEINEVPDQRPGFNADGLYIVPVAIRGQAYFE